MKNNTNAAFSALENAPVLYTPENIMAIMQVSRSTVYKLFNSETFPSIKMGSMLRIEKTAFEEWLRSDANKGKKAES